MGKRWLGAWSFSITAYDIVRSILEDGKTILEFGSGAGTGELAKIYTMYSIEQNQKYVDKYDSTYIYAPIKLYDKIYQSPYESQFETGWYDYRIIQENLPKKYDMIFIDGPTKRQGRAGFYKHIDLFDTSVPIVLDDINRESNLTLLKKISERIHRPYSTNKEVGVILGVIS